MSNPRSASRIWPMLLIALGPVASVSLLLALTCRGTLLDCVAIWHDETMYWNEIAVFYGGGFDGGYTAANETIARAPWVHFAAHGPFYPAFMGLIARVTALTPTSIALVNVALCVAASCLWLAIVRPNTKQAWIAAFLVNTFWPLVAYLPSSMQEGLHYALAFAIAGVSTALIRAPKDFRWQLASLLVVVAAAQIRVTWGWILLPLAWVVLQPRTWLSWIGLLLGSGVLIGGLYGEAIWLYAPFPNFMGDVLETLKHDPLGAVTMILKHASKGTGHYLTPTRDNWLEVGLRYQVMLITGAACYHVWRGRRKANEPPAIADEPARQSLLAFGFVALNMLSILAFVIAFYDIFDWRDYRVVAPHLFVSLLVLVGIGAKEWLGGYAALAVLLGVAVVPQFREFHQERVAYDQAQIAEFAQEIGQLIPFDPQANPWDNTVVLHIDHINTPLVASFPPGIGIAPVLDWKVQAMPPRSRYVLLQPKDLPHVTIPPHLKKIAATRLGDLYKRSDASDAVSTNPGR